MYETFYCHGQAKTHTGLYLSCYLPGSPHDTLIRFLDPTYSRFRLQVHAITGKAPPGFLCARVFEIRPLYVTNRYARVDLL